MFTLSFAICVFCKINAKVQHLIENRGLSQKTPYLCRKFQKRVLFMLTRRHIRIKILQNLYAVEVCHEYDMQKAEDRLIKSVESLYDLYIYQLSFIREMMWYAENKIEERRNKKLPSAEDLNPNLRFVENEFLLTLINNSAQTRNFTVENQLGNLPRNNPKYLHDIYGK
jgi:N utilization substance protein B